MACALKKSLQPQEGRRENLDQSYGQEASKHNRQRRLKIRVEEIKIESA
jgi:hypothetical protein